MASPLSTLRKYQFGFFVFFGVVCMLVFVIGDPLDTWLRSRSGGGTRSENKVVVTWRGGALRENEIGYSQSVRNVIREFIRTLLTETQKKNGSPRVQMLSLSPSEEDIVYTHLLAQRAEAMGMVVSDEAALLYLEQLSAQLIPRNGIGQIFKESVGGRITEQQLLGEIKSELLAQNYLNLTYPDLTRGQLPAQAWEYHLRLHRRVKAEVIPIRTESLKAKVTRQPTEAEIQSLYAKAKDRFPDPASPEPGFKRQRKAAFQFVNADRKKFEEAEAASIKPQITEPEIQEYYDKNRAEFRAPDTQQEPPKAEPPKPDAAKTDPTLPVSKPEEKKPESPAPAEKSPAEKSPAEKSPAEKSPAEKPPAEKPSGENSAAESVPETIPEEKKEQEKKDEKPTSSPPLNENAGGGVAGGGVDCAEALASDEPVSEPTKQEKPAADKPAAPAAEAPAEVKPAPASPAPTGEEKKEATAEQATETPPSPTVIPEPKFKPLDDLLKEEIRGKIAKQRALQAAQQKLDKGFDEIKRAVEKYARESRSAELTKKPAPAKLELAKLAETHGMTAGETPLSDPTEIQKTSLGRTRGFNFSSMSFEPVPFHVLAYRDGISLWTPEQIRGSSADGNPDDEFLYWKIQEVEPYVPELKDVRAEVVEAWTLREAFVPAEVEAKRLAEKAKQSGKSLREVFADSKEWKVAETNEFTWMTRGFLPANMGGMPSPSAVDNVEHAGEEFMRAVFALKAGEVGVAVNQPKSILYLVRVASESPSEDVLRDQFLQTGNSNDVQQVAALDRMQLRQKWFEALRKEMDLKWTRDPQS